MPEDKVTRKAAKKAPAKTAKKAAKKVAKKAAKKTPKHPGEDARRAFEHMHRLQILHKELSGDALSQLDTLVRYAQAAFPAGGGKAAADLLRAGEHLAFGTLAGEDAEEGISAPLQDEIKREYQHHLDHAAEHWEGQDGPPRELKAIYKSMRSGAQVAWKNKAKHRALELARGAHALARTDVAGLKLDAPQGPTGLLGTAKE